MSAIDPTKAKVKTSFSHPATFYSLALDPAGKRLYAGSEDYGIHVFDLDAPKKEPVAKWQKHDNYVTALVAVARKDKTLVVSGSYDRSLIWWDAAKGEPIRTVGAHDGWLRDLRALPDGSRLVSCGDDMLVKLWETDSGKLLRTFEGHDTRTPQGHVTALYVVAVSPDGKHLASGDRHGTVIVWETDNGKIAAKFEVPTLYTYDPRQRKRSIGGIRSLTFAPDGLTLAVGGIGQVGNVDGLEGPAHVEVWDWKKPQMRMTLNAQGHKAMFNELLWHPSEPWLIGGGGGSDGGLLAFWKIEKLPDAPKKDAVTGLKNKIDGHIHRINLSADGTELYAAGYHKLDVWSLAS
jgi:WD40 repeat protein